MLQYVAKYSLMKFANFLIIVLRAEIVTTFGSNMVKISTRNTKLQLRQAIFPVFYKISRPNFGILLLKGSY